MVKITTKQQFEVLIEEMERHPSIARGVRQFGEDKNSVNRTWAEIAQKLNGYGPPTRSGEDWQRVWVHYKAKLKKKLSGNKKNMLATGGGPSQEKSLSSLEQAASAILQMDAVINPVGEVFGAETRSHVHETQQLVEEVCAQLTAQDAQATQDPSAPEQEAVPAPKPKRKKKPEEKRFELLQQQTATQTNMLTALLKIEKALYKKNQILKDIKSIMQKKYEDKQEERNLNIKIKRKELEILNHKLEMM